MQIPFLGLNRSPATCTDPDHYGSLVGQVLPLQIYLFDHPRKKKLFFNRASVVALGGMTILSTLGSAIRGEVVQSSDAKLVIPFGSFLHHYQLDQQTYKFSDSCLFIPEPIGMVSLESSVCAAVVISLSSATLLPPALAMAGEPVDEQAIRTIFERPAILDRHVDSRRNQLHQQLIAALHFIDHSLGICGGIDIMLRLDDLIRRLIVMLLIPSLLNGGISVVGDPSSFAHADLVDWMLAHLDQPISLTEIEQRSNYSRRSLQYAFKRRFGCGPMQWLRQQRLAKARTMLETRQGASITAVSQACGYLSQASFSRDYRLRFGETPSTTWRRYRHDAV